MARSHYVMDLYYPTGEASGRLRREVMRIEAADDEEALAEGQRIDGWRKTQFYQIRAIHNSSRAGDKLIYTSEVAEVAPAEIADEPADAVLTIAPTPADSDATNFDADAVFAPQLKAAKAAG